MQKDLLVAIFAATDTEDPTTGVFGTGYPMTEDLILTSRHVVMHGNQNIPGRIEVKWFYDEQPSWIKADLVWTGRFGRRTGSLSPAGISAAVRAWPAGRAPTHGGRALAERRIRSREQAW